jgi:hypothetical protein
MAYYKASLKSNGDKASPSSNYFEKNIYQTNINPYGLHSRFDLHAL